MTNIAEGFQITDPNIFIPWNINKSQLTALFEKHNLKYVTESYYVANCTSLDGLNCMIGFHFKPTDSKGLSELEFFRTNYDDQEKSFTDFQNHFEAAFGKPTSINKGDVGFNNYQWLLNGVLILHLVYDRFGPEEHMRIIKRKV